MIEQKPRTAIVLLVEDNLDHAFLTKEAFADAKLKVQLHHVDAGDRAMAFLLKEAPYENAPTPDLILLDIHMPRMDGYEVMEAINKHDSLKQLVVVVLTTSTDSVDVDRMYQLGCRSYLSKPVAFPEFTQLVTRLSDYWFELVVLPVRR